MTDYFVRSSGSDAAAGTSAGAAWLTIDKAANTVAAGDTVYIGAGVYRELVTMDTSGSGGSPIQFIADIDGSKTGDPGLVLISAYDDEASAVVRTMCLDTNAKTFITWRYVQFIGGSAQAVGNTANAAHIAYEGLRFEYCLFQASNGAYSFQIEINNGATPTTDGLYMLGCRFFGATKFLWDSNGSAHINLKWRFENCVVIGSTVAFTEYGFDLRRITNGGAFTIGGITFAGCLAWNCDTAIFFSDFANTTNVTRVANTRFIDSGTCVNSSSGTTDSVAISNCLASNCTTLVFGGVTWPVTLVTDSVNLMAGIHDFPLINIFGWSPHGHLFTPLVSGIVGDAAVDTADAEMQSETTDMYGDPRQMGGSPTGLIYYFDGSDDATSDPNSAWNGDGAAITASLIDEAYTTTVGSSSSNYLFAGGTNAPAYSSTIASVECRVLNYVTGGATGTLEVYTDGLAESLGTVTLDKSTGSPIPSSMRWSEWTALSAPTGGWTWAKVQALEFKVWKATAGTFVALTLIEVRVIPAEAGMDVGPVEARGRPTRSATWAADGSMYSMAFDSTGFYESRLPVDAVSTTISVKAYKDASYAGTAPMIEVFIGKVSQGTASMTVGNEVEETLSVNFTPSEAGWTRVRLHGYATAGTVYFDSLAVT